MSRKILVTGAAGFIGSHLVDHLLAAGDSVTGIDNFNAFYDAAVKRENIANHLKCDNYSLCEGDIRDRSLLRQVFAKAPFDVIVHLAAMAGVRPSLQEPSLYMDVNVTGTQNLLDEAVKYPNSRFVLGSSSSVYGERSGEQFLETDRTDQPLSPYAASKGAAELLCYTAHHSYALPVVALRFFTVYGPRQRPDLAIHKFCAKIHEGEPIEVFGDGKSKRDYTYVADIVSGIVASLAYSGSGYDIFNLGRSEPVELLAMIRTIEQALKKKARINFKEIQQGDVPYTFANIDKARMLLNYRPTTSFEHGIAQFVEWFQGRLAHAK